MAKYRGFWFPVISTPKNKQEEQAGQHNKKNTVSYQLLFIHIKIFIGKINVALQQSPDYVVLIFFMQQSCIAVSLQLVWKK